jgi:hypothetical protein
MKAYGGVNVQIYIFVTSALAGSEWSASRPCRFTPEERAPGTHCLGGWVDPRAGLDDLEKRKFLTLLGLELRPLGHPAHSQLLYRLHHPGKIKAVHSFNMSVNFHQTTWRHILDDGTLHSDTHQYASLHTLH